MGSAHESQFLALGFAYTKLITEWFPKLSSFRCSPVPYGHPVHSANPSLHCFEERRLLAALNAPHRAASGFDKRT